MYEEREGHKRSVSRCVKLVHLAGHRRDGVPDNSLFRWRRGCSDLVCYCFPLYPHLLDFSCLCFISTHMYARGWKTKVTIPRLLWVDEVISVQSSFARKECLAIFFDFPILVVSHPLRIWLLSSALTPSLLLLPCNSSAYSCLSLLVISPCWIFRLAGSEGIAMVKADGGWSDAGKSWYL